MGIQVNRQEVVRYEFRAEKGNKDFIVFVCVPRAAGDPEVRWLPEVEVREIVLTECGDAENGPRGFDESYGAPIRAEFSFAPSEAALISKLETGAEITSEEANRFLDSTVAYGLFLSTQEGAFADDEAS